MKNNKHDNQPPKNSSERPVAISNKLKKQKRRLFAIIATSLFTLCMAMFIFFTVVACKNKQEIIFSQLTTCFEGYIGSTVRNTSNLEPEKQLAIINHNFNFGYINNVQLFLFDNNTNKLVAERKNAISANAYWQNKEPNTGLLIDYEDFRSSMTDEQYNKISEYLSAEPDSDGKIYRLFCSEYYHDILDVKPSKVEIFKTTEFDGLADEREGEFVESFELNPKNIDKLTLRTTETSIDNYIINDFFFGKYEIENLLAQIEGKQEYTYFDFPFGSLYYTAPLEFIFYYEDIISVDNEYGNFVYKGIYAQKVNLLEWCMEDILLIFFYVFTIFIIVGIIISVIIWKTLKKQIEQENRLRTVTNAMAHELKTPLFIIGGYAENLAENINNDKRTHYAEVITEQTKSMNELVSKMLDFSKLDSESFIPAIEKFDLSATIKEVAENYQLNKNQLECDKNFLIDADKKLITSVIENLIDNAVKYSTDREKISVKLINGTLTVQNPYRAVTKQEIDDMWKPYYRSTEKEKADGHGLGLAIVKNILDLHKFKCNAKYSDNNIIFTVIFK